MDLVPLVLFDTEPDIGIDVRPVECASLSSARGGVLLFVLTGADPLGFLPFLGGVSVPGEAPFSAMKSLQEPPPEKSALCFRGSDASEEVMPISEQISWSDFELFGPLDPALARSTFNWR